MFVFLFFQFASVVKISRTVTVSYNVAEGAEYVPTVFRNLDSGSELVPAAFIVRHPHRLSSWRIDPAFLKNSKHINPVLLCLEVQRHYFRINGQFHYLLRTYSCISGSRPRIPRYNLAQSLEVSSSARAHLLLLWRSALADVSLTTKTCLFKWHFNVIKPRCHHWL